MYWRDPGRALRNPRGPFRMVREDGTALTLNKHSDRGIHSFLDQLSSGVDYIPVMEQVAFIGVDQDGMVHLLHSLFSVPVDLYYTIQCICLLC